MATYEFGPEDGRLLVKTSRTGLGRRAGHDLTIEATRWSAHVGEESAEVTVEVDGLEAREGTGGALPLSDRDRGEIKKNLRKVLHADRYPTITFRSGRVGEDGADGELEIVGRSEPLRVTARLEDDRLTGGATVKQSRWGIKPYSAFFGALKLADEVEVAFDLRIPAG